MLLGHYQRVSVFFATLGHCFLFNLIESMLIGGLLIWCCCECKLSVVRVMAKHNYHISTMNTLCLLTIANLTYTVESMTLLSPMCIVDCLKLFQSQLTSSDIIFVIHFPTCWLPFATLKGLKSFKRKTGFLIPKIAKSSKVPSTEIKDLVCLLWIE